MTEQTLDETTYCAVHPDRETGLRCNKCDRLMCGECAVATPVGYRCKQCVRQVEDRFYNMQVGDYAIIFTLVAALSAVAGFLVSMFGFIFIWLILAFPIGAFIAGVPTRFLERKSGRYKAQVGVGALVIGAFFGAATRMFLRYNELFGEFIERGLRGVAPIPDMGTFILENTFGNISLLLFVVLAAVAVYTRYR